MPTIRQELLIHVPIEVCFDLARSIDIHGTLMVDTFDYTSPFGGLGKLVDHLFLAKYMTQFLEKRNYNVKKIAEETAESARSAR